jgi:hypothetical protein
MGLVLEEDGRVAVRLGDVRLLSDPANPAARTGTYAHELETIESSTDAAGNPVPGLAGLHGYQYNPATSTYEPTPTRPTQVFSRDPTLIVQPPDTNHHAH